MSSAWDTINRNRRSEPRRKVRLSASVSLVEQDADESQWPSVLAYTRDISASGMSLIVPSTQLGCHDLKSGDYLLRIILAISNETSVRITARLVHCELANQKDSEIGFLLGVKIEELSADDRVLYDEVINSPMPLSG
ncbi:MAG TPA: PilZ domain-containing protein [Pyrinomonadaceae bacterium]|jgi:hypothetical protein|nr:PilZ domain-containing protein [Pyrinomonadaceae bacterium]